MLIKYYSGTTVEHEMLGNVLRSYYGDDSKTRDLLSLFAMNSLLGYSGVINRQQDMVYKFQTTSLPEPETHDLTFDECCLRRGQEIWRMAQDRPVIVFWSGGIDSTVVLTALIATNDDWTKKLIIYTSEHATKYEYPWFWDRYLKKLPSRILINQDFNNPEIYQPDAIVLSGHCGDQLWGINWLRFIHDADSAHWSDFMSHDHFLQRIPLQLRNILIEYIKRQIEIFPRPINTIKDLIWMLNFTHAWDYVRLRPMVRLSDLSLLDRMIHFYDNWDFQTWAMNNPQSRIWTEWREYKQTAKDFIYRLTKDDHYRRHKCKELSLRYCCDEPSLEPYWTLITDHGARSRHDPANHIAGHLWLPDHAVSSTE